MIYDLKATKRESFGRALFRLRKTGITPAIIYGPELKESVSVFLNLNEFIKIYKEAGESAIIKLAIEGDKAREVLIKDVVFDPVRGVITHVDFYQFKAGQKLELEATIKFIGEAPAVKELGGILVKNLHALTIRCLPKDIISEVVVDLSSLKAFDAKIHVSDLKVPEGVEILQDKNDVVIVVKEPEKEEEVKPAAEAVAMPEVAGKPKEGEAAAEGAAGAKAEEKK